MFARHPNRPSSAWHKTQRRQVAIFGIALILVTTFIILLRTRPYSNHPFAFPKLKWNSFRPFIQFSPSMEFMNGTDAIWQIPNSPKAILFIAHGCSGKAANFWDRSPGCPNCVGLPEERLLVLHALARKFAVLTISSTNVCWDLKRDRKIVKGILKWWIEKNKLEGLPLTALGASSGGYFISALATDVKFRSVVLMISEGVFEAMEIPRNYPPTLFVHMPKDRARVGRIAENMEALRAKGIDVGELKCMEFPLTPRLLSDRIPGLDQTTSIAIFEIFKEKGIVNDDGYMRNDGRKIDWKESLKERDVLSDKYEWSSHIQEELNLAFGYHEMTSLQSEQILNWFESHLSRF
ncbi:uncharacterized protein LOC18448890 [Amborella trichopoda]|uniref:Uncharacterized protein n=1 Tax=Amborella trichopoda TaxID=13333 RepID=U5DD55_AMBTC|nr:uncharacterized protein LOC18448890 [Amborella trichopoda]ERN20474.1 hypothetical protein AMTR_s00068p00157910 [Amborella trichopoda]|eukprot:XP_006859007.1 uncharacterized protein LOC18448890 [Amborella trichopoda]